MIEIKIGINDLKNMINATKFAISRPSDRYYLDGFYFHSIEKGKIRAVGTNGHILSIIDCKADYDDDFNFFIPYSDSSDLLDSISVAINQEGCKRVKLKRSDHTLEVVFLGKPNVSWDTLKQYNDNYVDYNRVIPKSEEFNVVLLRKPFLDELKRIKGMSSEKVAQPIDLFIREDDYELNAVNSGCVVDGVLKPDLHYTYFKNDLVRSSGEHDFKVRFSMQYMIKILSSIKSKTVKFSFFSSKDSCHPITITATEEPNRKIVLMPIRR